MKDKFGFEGSKTEGNLINSYLQIDKNHSDIDYILKKDKLDSVKTKNYTQCKTH